MSLYFQNPNFLDEEGEGAVGVSDSEVYQNDLKLALMAEPLGFDSVWSVEHHFGGYSMVPNVLQFLAYMAGCTNHVSLGSAAVILPWHEPVRVAGSIVMLDNLCGGRFILGIGRGLGRVEFEGMGVAMAESRSRFVESAQMVLNGLEQGYVEGDGPYYKQVRRWLRPAPMRSFKGRTYAAAVSPESMEIMARLGLGILVIPQKPWATAAAELEVYKTIYRDVNGEEPPPPIIAGQVFCDEDEGRARDLGRQYIGKYFATVIKQYEFGGSHFEKTAGYEYYNEASKRMQAQGEDNAEHFYTELQVYGTPDQCVDKIAAIKELLGCETFLGVFSYAGIPHEEAVRNVHLFSDKVHPRVKAM